jgi:hypothetical protein
MRPGAWRWLSALLVALNLAGCKSATGTHTYPPDPLFLLKKPLEARAENAPPMTLVSAESVSPPLPYRLVVARYGRAAPQQPSPGESSEPPLPCSP